MILSPNYEYVAVVQMRYTVHCLKDSDRPVELPSTVASLAAFGWE